VSYAVGFNSRHVPVIDPKLPPAHKPVKQPVAADKVEKPKTEEKPAVKEEKGGSAKEKAAPAAKTASAKTKGHEKTGAKTKSAKPAR
jgi:hypothetical protein